MRKASLLRRLGAIVYDSLLLFALLMLVTVPFIILRQGEAVEPLSDMPYRLTLLLTIFVFFVGFWLRGGRTLGMQAWRLQVQMRDGSAITPLAASLRFFSALLSWAPAGLGFLWQLWDSDDLTWHDRLSGTHLVYFPKQD